MSHTETYDTTRSEEQRRLLLQLLQDMDGHIAALQDIGHKRLAAATGAPSSVELTIRVGAERYENDAVAAEEALGVPTCVTVRVPCGTSVTGGFIYCEISYCETTGPITVLPG